MHYGKVGVWRRRREDLNILVVLRAMGCVSDAEAMLHIGCEPAFEPLLAATLHDARQPGNIGSQRNTQLAALEWIGAPCRALHFDRVTVRWSMCARSTAVQYSVTRQRTTLCIC